MRFEQALTPLARVNCVPGLYPHPTKHIHSIREHGQAADCMFYAILDREEYGIYNDLCVPLDFAVGPCSRKFSSQIATILKEDPGIIYVSDKHWIGITTKWRQNCEKHHRHPLMQSRSRSTSPLDSASAFDTDSPHASPPRTPSPGTPPGAPTSDTPSRSRIAPLPRPGLHETPSLRETPSRSPSKVPTAQPAKSPAPIFPRPVYSQSPTLLPYPARLLNEMGTFPPDPPRHRARTGPNPPPQYQESVAASSDASALAEDIPTAGGAVVYAVSVHNLVFKSQYVQPMYLCRSAHGVFSATMPLICSRTQMART